MEKGLIDALCSKQLSKDLWSVHGIKNCLIHLLNAMEAQHSTRSLASYKVGLPSADNNTFKKGLIILTGSQDPIQNHSS
jgi:hypothetical protein